MVHAGTNPSGDRSREELAVFTGECGLEGAVLGHSQNHLAVAGGYAVGSNPKCCAAPTRYREVVLTLSKYLSKVTGSRFHNSGFSRCPWIRSSPLNFHGYVKFIEHPVICRPSVVLISTQPNTGIAVANWNPSTPHCSNFIRRFINEKFCNAPFLMGDSFRGKLRYPSVWPGNNWQHPRRSQRSKRSGCLRRESYPH
jgi:hypothetical protein